MKAKKAAVMKAKKGPVMKAKNGPVMKKKNKASWRDTCFVHGAYSQ